MNIKGIKSNKIVINGTQISGGSILIRDGKVFIDGKELDENKVSSMINNANIKIEINGDVEQVDTVSGDVVVNGLVGKNINTVSGDVRAGSVYGYVSTVSGSIGHYNPTSPKRIG